MKELNIIVDEENLRGSRPELAVRLRGKPYYLSLRQIGKLLGVSQTAVQKYLKKEEITGNRFSWLRPRWLSIRTDEEISVELGITLSNVMYYRTKYRVRKLEWVNVIYRKENLIKTWFGDQYTFGPQFNKFLKKVCQTYIKTERQRDIILNYYLHGAPTLNTTRVFRSQIIRELKEQKFLGDIPFLLETGVLEYV